MHRGIYFWNKLPNQIINGSSVNVLKSNWMIFEIMVRKRIQDGVLKTIEWIT